jgi:GNAT superfamily N-acetyltransferase
MRIAIGPITPGATPDPAALPAEWSAWSEEPGRAVRVEEDGDLLGIIHAVVVGQTEAWVEGLWVKPAARGRGVGRRLIAEAIALVRGYGATVVRTAVPARDYGALAVAERTGFARHCEAVVLVAEMPEGPIDIPYEAQVSAATVKETATVTRLLEETPALREWRGLVPLGWRFRRLAPELVKGLIKDGRALRAGDGPVGAALCAVRNEWAVISVMVGPPAHRQALFGVIVEEAHRAGARRVALFAPDAGGAAGLRAAFAPHPWCPDGLVIVQRTLPVG